MNESLDLRQVRADTFERMVGNEFTSREPRTVLVLADVVRYPVQPHAPRSEPFSLVFVGDAGLEQRIYELENPGLGRIDVFLVPLGPGPDGQARYEAAFN